MRYIELSRAPCNQTLEIHSVNGEYGGERRVESMGIRRGSRVRKITCHPFGGPVVIELNGSKISLGRGIAAKIEVEVLSSPPVKRQI